MAGVKKVLGFCRQLPMSSVAMRELRLYQPPVLDWLMMGWLLLKNMLMVPEEGQAVSSVGLRTSLGVGYWTSEPHCFCIVFCIASFPSIWSFISHI